MTAITAAFSDLTTLFGVFTVLAIAVTGFMVGKRWLKKTG